MCLEKICHDLPRSTKLCFTNSWFFVYCCKTTKRRAIDSSILFPPPPSKNHHKSLVLIPECYKHVRGYLGAAWASAWTCTGLVEPEWHWDRVNLSQPRQASTGWEKADRRRNRGREGMFQAREADFLRGQIGLRKGDRTSHSNIGQISNPASCPSAIS